MSSQAFRFFDIAPATLDEVVSVTYARQTVPGLSHKRSQFMNTNNKILTFDLFVDGLISDGDDFGPDKVEKTKRFLYSLCYPRASRRIDGAGPPKAMLSIGPMNVVGYVEEVSIQNTRFYSDLSVRAFKASIKFVEELDRRKTSGQLQEFQGWGS